MATILPFRSLRPPRDLVKRVAAPPYDVVSAAEARALVAENPESFLRISLPETNLAPEATASPDEIHRLGRATLEDFEHRGSLIRDREPRLLVYRQRMGDAVQTGVVGCATVEEYRQGLIATHEHTRPDKETDRTRHIEALGAHDEPVFLMYRPDAPGTDEIARIVNEVTAGVPEYDFTADDGVAHTLWTVGDDHARKLSTAFGEVPQLYIADGHHRSAAAARVGEDTGHDEAAFFPVVVFPADVLTILAYNRVVRDLGEHTPASFLDAVAADFDVEPSAAVPAPAHHQFGVFLNGQWSLLTVREGSVDETDPIARLDVSILQERVLAPLLGIDDPRTDQRIAFIGGVRGTGELERLVDDGEYAVAFALHPTSPGEVMDVADLGLDMPPKSTWFEPKLRSGLFVHPIDL